MHFVQPSRTTTHLTFVGGGTLACAILDGLSEQAASTALRPSQRTDYSVSITVRRQECIEQISKRYPGAYVTDNNDDEKLWLFDHAPAVHIILICTKPHSTSDVCERIRLAHDKSCPPCQNLPVVVTMCPGITISKLETWLRLGKNQNSFTVVRTMPNTPVSIRQGATAFFTSEHATDEEVESVVALFRVFSPCVERLLEENLLDVAAAVSGSGPAYIFQLYKCLVAAGVECGLPEGLARALVTQTGVGSSLLANNQAEVPLQKMIRDVCVPGGSTEKGMKSLEDAGFQAAVANAVSRSLEANRAMG
ncbi:pyrroline-5-carboxylate reductase dimerization-domain-containing protein [Clohesyomyces aquaticus]|uniref:Pyrroline-5-carboxylate reductase dimerization-domain-containing protein n=1 Tax=Clohesyomyces aquaticus TaxID=1231657 RepID=A0A1Y1ZNH9_9PLEO|nr:pyrroline-5-carboxylate reductase dimerization-domain-containing protein [Clohesyomyces aquaticus]